MIDVRVESFYHTNLASIVVRLEQLNDPGCWMNCYLVLNIQHH